MAGLTEAVEAIRSGALVIVPTDTVYGFGARPEAAAAIFDVKRRPRDKALPVLGSDVVQLGGIAELDDNARALAEAHWPGPPDTGASPQRFVPSGPGRQRPGDGRHKSPRPPDSQRPPRTNRSLGGDERERLRRTPGDDVRGGVRPRARSRLFERRYLRRRSLDGAEPRRRAARAAAGRARPERVAQAYSALNFVAR